MENDHAIITGHKLDGHVLGNNLCPPEFLPRTTPGKTVKTPNSEFDEWVSNDQFILGWLYNTMSTYTIYSVDAKLNIEITVGCSKRTSKGAYKIKDYLLQS